MAGGNKKIHEHPRQTAEGFQKNPQNINRKGQPPKLLRHINDELKASGYEPVSKSQLEDAFQLLINLDEEKIKALAADKNTPFFLRRVISYLGTAKGMEMMDRIMDRAFGKATNNHNVNGGIDVKHDHDLSNLSVEQIKKLLKDERKNNP